MKTLNHKKTKKSILYGILILAVMLLIATAGLYVGVAHDYRDKFLCGTYVNGIDVGRMTAGDVKAMLAGIAENYTISVTLRGIDGPEAFLLGGKDFGLHYTSGKDVDALMDMQNAWEWPRAYHGTRWERVAGLDTEYEEPELRAAFQRLLERRREQAPADARYTLKKDGGFAIKPESEGNKLLRDAACAALLDAVAKRERSLDLSGDEWYEHPAVHAADEALVKEVARLNAFLDKTVSVSMPDGSVRKIGREQMLQCLSKTDNGRYAVSEDAIRALAAQEADAIGAALDTTASKRAFTSTLRGTIWFVLEQTDGILVDRARTAAAGVPGAVAVHKIENPFTQ